jgi:hypothetical protein
MYKVFIGIFGLSIAIILIMYVMKSNKAKADASKPLNPNEFIIDISGKLDLSKLKTESTNILASGFWTDTPNIGKINSSLDLKYNSSTGSISGFIIDNSYDILINFYINTKPDFSVSTNPNKQIEKDIFTAPLNITVGFGTEALNNKITERLATESNSNPKESPFICGTGITANIKKDMLYSYIYVDNPTKELLSEKKNCTGKITITIRKK